MFQSKRYVYDIPMGFSKKKKKKKNSWQSTNDNATGWNLVNK
jgi:hypothetical protein